VVHGEQSSPMLMGNPCPGEPEPSPSAITSTNIHYTFIVLDLGIKESKHFGPMEGSQGKQTSSWPHFLISGTSALKGSFL
jgi:hypothetical protein